MNTDACDTIGICDGACSRIRGLLRDRGACEDVCGRCESLTGGDAAEMESQKAYLDDERVEWTDEAIDSRLTPFATPCAKLFCDAIDSRLTRDQTLGCFGSASSCIQSQSDRIFAIWIFGYLLRTEVVNEIEEFAVYDERHWTELERLHIPLPETDSKVVSASNWRISKPL